MKNVWRLILVLLILVFWGQEAYADAKKIALVIGNANYKTGKLSNPVNDAKDFAGVLEKCGFSVILETDINRKEFRKSIFEFSKNLKKSDVGLFYYAGHGLQVDGVNYLVPIGADLKARFDVDDQCLKVAYILDAMEEYGDRMNIIILDACRDNPFRSCRGLGRGLAMMEAPSGSILAYATGPGSVASDGNTRNGLYTEKLLRHMLTPGLRLLDLFMTVRNEVKISSSNKQIPWETHSLTRPFFFLPQKNAGNKRTEKNINPIKAVDYAELIRQRKEVKKSWETKWKEMESRFFKTEEYECAELLSPEEKANAWGVFLRLYSEDNPYSMADDSFRHTAEIRQSFWNSKSGASKPISKK